MERWSINHDELNDFRAFLERRQRELRRLADDGREAAGTVVLDQSSVGRLSRMDAMQGQAMARASQDRRRRQLRSLTAALARIESGDYGYCVVCDGEIARGRLEADPAAAFCIGCAEQREGCEP